MSNFRDKMDEINLIVDSSSLTLNEAKDDPKVETEEPEAKNESEVLLESFDDALAQVKSAVEKIEENMIKLKEGACMCKKKKGSAKKE